MLKRFENSPAPCSEKDFLQRDVMVGVLRNREQLGYNIDYGFYHIPEEWVPERRLPIKYVALYQAAKFFPPGDTGVYVYGRVKDVELVARGSIDIPTRQSLKKLYYKFHVESWLTLPEPIRLSNVIPPVNVFTSVYQFQHAANTAELALEEKAHWDFYHVCKERYRESIVLSRYGRACGVRFGEYVALWDEKRVRIRRGRRTVLKMKNEIFRGVNYRALLRDFAE